MKRFVIVWGCLLGLVASQAQKADFNPDYLNYISQERLKKHVEVLASDSLEGRNTGEAGQQKAARYIAAEFQNAGLKPLVNTTFYQAFNLWQTQWGEIAMKVNARELLEFDDMVYLSSREENEWMKKDLVFGGYGKEENIQSRDINDKIVLVLTNNLKSYFSLSNRLMKQGAFGILLINHHDNSQFTKVAKQYKKYGRGKQMSFEKPNISPFKSRVFGLSNDAAEGIFNLSVDSLYVLAEQNLSATVEPVELSFRCEKKVEQIQTANVAGWLPGTNTNDEAIVVTAHYDHLGKQGEQVFYGADDNASGTAALMELATAFGRLPKTHKHLIFVATTAEEKGLLGAFHFVRERESYNKKLVANVNIDMIGRRDSVNKENYIYLIGTDHFPQLDSLANAANNLSHPLTLDDAYIKNQHGFGNILQLSDHYAFYEKGIPIIGFFSGLHHDYHTAFDTADKIEYEEMWRRTQLIFTTLFLAADEDMLLKK